MLTVLESLKLSTDFLEKKGIESARLNAELLLTEILGCKRLDLYLKFDQPLKDGEIDQYREWISRRGKFEPLQYIIGKVEFYGLPFKVTRDVLIPRPETEILVEEVINYCKGKIGMKILDIGTGSGNMPIALAKHLTNAEIVTVDISLNAIEVAKENAQLNGVESKLAFIHSDVTLLEMEPEQYDIIISNPPYVSSEEYPTLQKEIADYEPSIALTDEKDGLDYYRVISKKSKSFLKRGGAIFLEIGKGQKKDVENILSSQGFAKIKFIKDYQQIDRVAFGEMR
ncbi:peptide chain release factor N(5)-glutamine methyltransferase [bacterium]|nr:peptide chain release factor N(5)-glutamine methyltransferase [bacterium]